MNGARNEEDFMQQQQQDLPERERPPENHSAAHQHHHHQPPSPPPRCPRCDSSNTKFCYYNNYSLTQPRYFCKACRRYWTQGGTLRNVPVGGGCRKNKRPRISSPTSLSSNGFVPRTLTAAARPQNLTGAISGQPSRQAAPPLGGAFYGGGSFLPSFAAMQSLPAAGINQGATAMGGGSGRLGANMSLVPGMSFQSGKSPVTAPPHLHSPTPTNFFPPQRNLMPPGAFSSWTQSVINSGASSSSTAAAAGNWGSSGGGDRAGSSLTPNKWSDCNQGFSPSE